MSEEDENKIEKVEVLGEKQENLISGKEMSRRTFLKGLGLGVGVSVFSYYLNPIESITGYGFSDLIEEEKEIVSAEENPPRRTPTGNFMGAILDFFGGGEVTYKSVSNGSWNDPSVWDKGEVPEEDSEVIISSGDAVDLEGSTERLRSLRVRGVLEFDPFSDTHLKVDTFATEEDSLLKIGDPAQPISEGNEARITFIDRGRVGNYSDPRRKTRGLLIAGDISVRGKEKTAWRELEDDPTAGESSITVKFSPKGWKPGDEVIIPGLEPNRDQDEKFEIVSISGRTIELDGQFEYDHEPPREDLHSYVLNLSRNVVFESESEDENHRGHMMIMSEGSDVRYLELNKMGRTNKERPLTNPVRGEEELSDNLDPNPAARYPLHWHRVGTDTENPHIVEGAVVRGSPGWGIVNHHAYVNVRDSITYDVKGAGFVAEGGNERGSFERCFALRSKGSGETLDSRSAGAHGGDPPIDDFGHAGHGFWLQSPRVEVVDCVAAGHRHHAFAWWLRPLLDKPEETLSEESCAGGDIEDSRVVYCPNIPVRFVEKEKIGPLLEAIELGRFSDSDELMRDTQKIPSTFAPLKKVEGNVAFASGGGVEFSRHNFKWKHERFEDFNTIEDMTIYQIGTFFDENGKEHSPSLPRHRASGHQGRGGNVGIAFRYTSNVKLKDSTVIGTGRNNSVGIPFHDYRWNVVVENCEIENWDWGVGTGEHALDWIKGCSFKHNEYDVVWTFDNVGPAVLENNEIQSIRHRFKPHNQKAGEILNFSQKHGVRVDGRTSYVAQSRPDYVPFPDTSSLGGINNIEATTPLDNEENIVGLTNQEMYDQYRVCIGGMPMPEDAVEESVVDGYLSPENQRNPPRSLELDATEANYGQNLEEVEEKEAADGKCLVVKESGSEPPSSEDTVKFTFNCADGRYRLFVRAWTRSWNGDTLYHRIDGGDWIKSSKKKNPASFRWHAASERNGPLHEADLGEGEHTLEIAIPNQDVKIDRAALVSEGTVVGGKKLFGTSENDDDSGGGDDDGIVDYIGSCWQT